MSVVPLGSGIWQLIMMSLSVSFLKHTLAVIEMAHQSKLVQSMKHSVPGTFQ